MTWWHIIHWSWPDVFHWSGREQVLRCLILLPISDCMYFSFCWSCFIIYILVLDFVCCVPWKQIFSSQPQLLFTFSSPKAVWKSSSLEVSFEPSPASPHHLKMCSLNTIQGFKSNLTSTGHSVRILGSGTWGKHREKKGGKMKKGEKAQVGMLGEGK